VPDEAKSSARGALLPSPLHSALNAYEIRNLRNSLCNIAAAIADVKEDVALKYFEFLFYEDQAKEGREDTLVGKPLLSSFYSKDKHRMIIVSSRVSSGESYFALMSVSELNMGFLAWKQRGYSNDPSEDIRLFMSNDGQEFDFEGW
jgi:hypothetical protein